MIRTRLLAVCLALTAPLFALSDKELFAKHWKTSTAFTIAVAEAMPEDAYNFGPNAEEMVFGKVICHIAQANNSYISAVAGTKPPAVPEKLAAAYKANSGFEKAAVVEFLKASFDFCTKALDGIGPEQLDKLRGPEGRQMTGAERLWGAFTHTAHHRGQAEVYLRVKNIKPPDYRF
jgi:uncharacterized damage-inducible protein DinB